MTVYWQYIQHAVILGTLRHSSFMSWQIIMCCFFSYTVIIIQHNMSIQSLLTYRKLVRVSSTRGGILIGRIPKTGSFWPHRTILKGSRLILSAPQKDKGEECKTKGRWQWILSFRRKWAGLVWVMFVNEIIHVIANFYSGLQLVEQLQCQCTASRGSSPSLLFFFFSPNLLQLKWICWTLTWGWGRGIAGLKWDSICLCCGCFKWIKVRIPFPSGPLG